MNDQGDARDIVDLNAEDLDLDRDAYDLDEGDQREATRVSFLQPGPLSFAGIVLSVASFLSLTSLDLAFEGRQSDGTGTNQVLSLAKHEAIGHGGFALVALLICLASVYLDDEDDPSWARHAARAGVIVAVGGLILNGVAFALAAAGGPAMTGNS